MAESKTLAPEVDPWTSEQKATATVATDEASYVCPHCGTPLEPHHDVAGSLHCNGAQCVQCCFLPPDASSNGAVVERLYARPCPMAQKGAF